MEVNNEGKLEKEQSVNRTPAEGITMEDLIARAKAQGAEGPMSPNMHLLIALRDVATKFDHTHGTITDSDACILLANAKMGEDKQGKTCADHFLTVVGCPTDLLRLLQQLFQEAPELAITFELATMLARGGTPVWDDDTLSRLFMLHMAKRMGL